MYLKMHADGMERDMLKKFVRLEDEFLQIENTSVCTQLPYIVQASIISNKIKEFVSFAIMGNYLHNQLTKIVIFFFIITT